MDTNHMVFLARGTQRKFNRPKCRVYGWNATVKTHSYASKFANWELNQRFFWIPVSAGERIMGRMIRPSFSRWDCF